MDKQDILDYLDAEVHPLVSPDHYYVYSNLHDMVSELPTDEAVPVIRCKDCKHSLQNQFTGDWFCWLYNIAREVEADGFCYKAERINSGQRYATDLIRCKDCKFRNSEDKRCNCGHDIIWQLPRDDEWYCADAKREL